MIHYIPKGSAAIIIQKALTDDDAIEIFKALPHCNVIHEFEVVPWARMFDRRTLTDQGKLPVIPEYELKKLQLTLNMYNLLIPDPITIDEFICLIQDPKFYCQHAAGIDMLCFPAPKMLEEHA